MKASPFRIVESGITDPLFSFDTNVIRNASACQDRLALFLLCLVTGRAGDRYAYKGAGAYLACSSSTSKMLECFNPVVLRSQALVRQLSGVWAVRIQPGTAISR